MLTRIPVSMIKASGADGSAVVVESGKLKSSDETVTTASEITAGFYDQGSGVLTLTFSNGQDVAITGFPTFDSIPEGPQGPQGEPGLDGQDGRDGRDGEEGPEGCAGPVGPTGDKGPRGEDGRPGQVGPPGPQGVQGPMGERGPTGAQGPQGKVGITGPTGETGPTGPQGDQGPAGTINIIISETDPGASAGPGAIWVNPAIGQYDDDLDQFAQGIDMSLTKPSLKMIQAGTVSGDVENTGTGLTVTAESNDSTQLSGTFDNVTGTLTLSIPGFDTLTIKNFMTQSDVGSGSEGPQGVSGTAGVDGIIGEEGLQGKRGCQGPQGAQGERGVRGPQGKQGEQGPSGPQGERGLAGLDGRVAIYISDSDPGPVGAGALWIKPV